MNKHFKTAGLFFLTLILIVGVLMVARSAFLDKRLLKQEVVPIPIQFHQKIYGKLIVRLPLEDEFTLVPQLPLDSAWKTYKIWYLSNEKQMIRMQFMDIGLADAGIKKGVGEEMNKILNMGENENFKSISRRQYIKNGMTCIEGQFQSGIVKKRILARGLQQGTAMYIVISLASVFHQAFQDSVMNSVAFKDQL